MDAISAEGFAAIGLGLGLAICAIGVILGWLMRWAWDKGPA